MFATCLICFILYVACILRFIEFIAFLSDRIIILITSGYIDLEREFAFHLHCKPSSDGNHGIFFLPNRVCMLAGFYALRIHVEKKNVIKSRPPDCTWPFGTRVCTQPPARYRHFYDFRRMHLIVAVCRIAVFFNIGTDY